MRRIRFTKEVDGYTIGQELDLEPGIADAYVAYRLAAVYVDQPEPMPARADKMVSQGSVRRKGDWRRDGSADKGTD